MRAHWKSNASGVPAETLSPGFSRSVFSSGCISCVITVKPELSIIARYAAVDRRETGKRSPSALGIAKSPRPKSVSAPFFASACTRSGWSTVASRSPSSCQHTCTLRERLLEATGGQFIEEHVGQHEVEAAIGEGKRILHIDDDIFRAINGEGGLSNAQKCLGLIRNEQATWELSREARDTGVG